MRKLLVVVDVQNDFVDGSLGTNKAKAIIPNVIEKINSWKGDIIATRDTHYENYLTTNEGKNLPVPHCINNTDGHKINRDVFKALLDKKSFVKALNKMTFGCLALPALIKDESYDYIELIGLCTDICVISNALILKAYYPEIQIAVDSKCCAGVTPEKHKAAIEVMKSCQINIINE